MPERIPLISTSDVDEDTGWVVVETPDLLPGWSVRGELDVSTGSPELIGLHLLRADHPATGIRRKGVKPAPLTTRALRSVRLGALLEEAQPHIRFFRLMGRLRPARGADEETKRAVWAVDYWRTTLSSRRPVVDVAVEWGVDRAQARDRIFMLREKGYLTGSGQGRAGGALTDRTLELLDAAGGRLERFAAEYRTTKGSKP